jgi:hypothetical protein
MGRAGVGSLVAVATLAAACARAGALSSIPGLFEARQEAMTLPRGAVNVTLVTPAKPAEPKLLILFATGDAGWLGVSGVIFEHLAARGHYAAAFDAKEILAPLKRSGELVGISDAAATIDTMIVESRRALGLPESTPVIVSGYSRGANLVVLTAGVPSLQHHVGGAIAVALTRETDFLKAPDPANRPAAVQVDAKGRIQTYPAIALAGPIPFAVIQSKGDKYVPSEEARRLFGPDTATRKLYEVDARNHGFSGGRDELLRDLDASLSWIEETSKTP